MRKYLALLFALALFVPLAACGGDDADGGSGSSSGSSSGTSDDEETTTTEGDDEEASGDTGDFCDAVQEAADSEVIDQLDFEDEGDLQVAIGVLEDIADTAPSELDADFEALFAFFEIVVDNFDDFSDPEAAAGLQEEFADEFEAFTEATTHLNEFSLDECGVTLDGTTADDSSTGTSTGSATGEDTSLEDFADDVDACEGGDMAACDALYGETPFGSEAEAVALECGGEDPGGNHTGDCEEVFG